MLWKETVRNFVYLFHSKRSLFQETLKTDGSIAAVHANALPDKKSGEMPDCALKAPAQGGTGRALGGNFTTDKIIYSLTVAILAEAN